MQMKINEILTILVCQINNVFYISRYCKKKEIKIETATSHTFQEGCQLIIFWL